MKFLLVRNVPQRRLAGLHGADGAQNVGKDLAGIVQLRAVFCLEGHVVALVRQQNQIVVLRGKRAGDGLAECFERSLVVQAGIAQRHEQAVFVGICNLTGSEAEVDQVFVLRTGQNAAEDGKVALLVLLTHERDRLAERGQNLAAGRNIEAAHGGHIGAVRAKSSPQLADFFGCHTQKLPLFQNA